MVDLTTWRQAAVPLYTVVRKYYALLPPLFLPILLVYDAPFGRFSLGTPSIFAVDGIKSWIFMELVSPATFTTCFILSPLSKVVPNFALEPNPQTTLAALFLVHYANRAVISPLRSPGRSTSHLNVVVSAIIFNIINGGLMGTYLSSPEASQVLASSFSRPSFWIGIGIWALGLTGNVLHDEILYNLRRSTQELKDKRTDVSTNSKKKYAVPYGWLYNYISYPNYFCEWIEWLGFALAAAPPSSFQSLFSTFITSSTPWYGLLVNAPPPWLFLLAEISTMLPRAYRGHRWYHNKFKDYPKERKVVIPFIL